MKEKKSERLLPFNMTAMGHTYGQLVSDYLTTHTILSCKLLVNYI